MSTETRLINWRHEDDEPHNMAHTHFTETVDLWGWCEIADEGEDLLKRMRPEYDEEYWEFSPECGLLDGVAAAAQHGAMKAVAAALGCNARALYLAVSPWLENKGRVPPTMVHTVPADVLKTAVRQWLEASEAQLRELDGPEGVLS